MTMAGDDDVPTRSANPNAPRIEFFTADRLVGEPGQPVTLFWSTRGADRAVIYRLDRTGQRTQVLNVPPDGSHVIQTRLSERGQIDFLLIVGEGPAQAEQTLSIPLACPVQWFFSPALPDCPDNEPQETFLIEQPFERGRMVYIGDRSRVYVLFNDGFSPAWISFDDVYNPAVHPESLENFVPPPGFFQPIARLGFVWRGNDTVRNRLGMGTGPEATFQGFLQTATTADGSSLYVSSADTSVLRLLPGGESWQIITEP
jgi:hypothetical protein